MGTKLFKMVLVLIVSGISMSQSDAQTTGLSGTATNTQGARTAGADNTYRNRFGITSVIRKILVY